MSQIRTNSIVPAGGLAGDGGGIIQIVQTVKTDTFSASGSGESSITGLSATITPSSTSNKILIMVCVNYDYTRSNSGGGFRIYRGGTSLTAATGDASGNRYRVIADFGPQSNLDQSGLHRTLSYLDSPSSTSSLTYQVYQFQSAGGQTFYLNRSQVDANETDDPRMSSTVTLMEISG